MASILLAGTGLSVSAAYGGGVEYQETYRPQYHFSPPSHWMNDPNGLIFLDGEYHLFYQHNPFSTQWGPMHWGHAISKDLVHWKNLPVALFPDDHGTIFSGSAVYDKENTSGLGTSDNPPVVAIFTSHDSSREKAGATDFQNESIAYSLDKGRSWTKYQDNPVLKNPGVRDFRDPKVSWFEPGQKWIMTLAVADHVAFYSSKDLKHWSHESDFGRAWGAHQGVWECPDLIALPVDGTPDTKDVLLVSINPGGPNGGSATQYFVGHFDGHEFALEADRRVRPSVSWVDYGTDDYAGVTWSGIPAADGRRLFLGWMSNWMYAQKVPTEPWRSAMTLPRELKLVQTSGGFELRSTPVAELSRLRTSTTLIHAQPVQSELELTRGRHDGGLIELDLTLETASDGLISLEFSNSKHQKAEFRINRDLHRYELDRALSGAVDFSKTFAGEQVAPLPGSAMKVSLRVFLDRSSIEVFINQGETVMTAIVFPSTPFDHIILKSSKPLSLTDGTLYDLKSIWRDQ